ncbi:MAG: prepilin peptidase [Vicinamibacterales bacterium]
MTEMQNVLPSIAALAVASAACATDIRNRRIPNILTFGAAAAAVAYGALTGGAGGVATAGAGWLAGTLIFLPFFLLRGMGAGDVKLLAALGAWLGPGAVLVIALYTSIAGGVMALGVALGRGYLRTALANITGLLRFWSVAGLRPAEGLTLETSTSPKLPYAIPLLAGTVASLWLR